MNVQVDRYARDRLLGIECDEDPCHTAVLFCTVCESHLCEKCAESSHDTNVLSKHRRIPLSEKPASTANCRIHNSYPIEFVCKEPSCSSRNELMCIFCRDYGLHKGHAHVLIEKETDELREKLQESISEVARTLSKVDMLKRRIQKAATELSSRERGPFSDALSQVHSHFNRLRESLSRDEEAAVDKLTSHVNTRVAALNSYIEGLDAISNKLNSTSSELQRSLVLDRSKLVERKSDLLALAEAASTEEIRSPEESLLSTLIPYSISRTNQLHLGQYEDARVVLLGLDGSGKTTLLRSLMRAPYVPDISPTNGFTVDSVHYKNFRFHFWDVSGLNRSRSVWKNYHTNAQAILFVVDSSSPERFPEVIRAVEEVVEDAHVDSCQFLLVVNRKATEHTPSCPSVASLLGSLTRFGQPIKVHYCDAASGNGVPELLDYLVDSLVPGRDTL
ncbi:ADP-ribosylation factor family protein [Oesophagostomum dentatum]|uniref:ADP-ribosylation factor family protein n=1 Tax=Oesophagostomum dentatum TaxID=61180 RepID=A0A0B1T813_OESDE|nr:ADP-ribosylation factor family protein [Oesophagostomum dentatum]